WLLLQERLDALELPERGKSGTAADCDNLTVAFALLRREEDNLFKRIGLFLITNLAILVLLSFMARILGVDRFLAANGLDMGALLLFAAVWGFGGALISLAISKWSAKMMVGAQVIENPSNPTERWLVDTVRRHAQLAGVGMPEVAIYDAPEINAFA